MNASKINVVVASLALILIYTYQLKAEQPTRKATEKLLSRFESKEPGSRSYTISNDMRRVAFREKVNGKEMAVIDGVKGKTYDSVNPIIFSPDGKRFAYAAKNGNKWILVVDNKVEASIDSIAGIVSIVFSHDGSSYAYLVNTGRKFYLVNNGIKGKMYDGINENSITFGENSQTVAYSVRRGKFQLAVVDGKEGFSFDEVGFPVISSGGKNYAYWAKKDRQSFAVLNGQTSKPYEDVQSIIFSPDGKHYAYEVVSQGQHMVVVDGIESDKYEMVHSLRYNSDGTQLVYTMELPEGDQEGFKQYVVINGKKTGPYETVMEGSLQFSSDGKHFAYKASRHNEFIYVVDGKEGKYYSDVLQATATFSPDNARFAYAAELNTKRMVIVDETEYTPFNDVFFIAFTPDSKRLIYSVRNGDKESVVVDNNAGTLYDSILGQGNVVIDAPNSFHYIAQKGNDIYLVEEILE